MAMTLQQALKKAKEQVLKQVDDVLSNEVLEAVRDAEVAAVEDVVYGTETSGYYQRRYDMGGLGDRYNMEIAGGKAKNGTMLVINTTPPNPYKNGRNESGGMATTNKDLPELVEYGWQSGYKYDWWESGRGRPFTQTAADQLALTNAHVDEMKFGLQKRGYKVV